MVFRPVAAPARGRPRSGRRRLGLLNAWVGPLLAMLFGLAALLLPLLERPAPASVATLAAPAPARQGEGGVAAAAIIEGSSALGAAGDGSSLKDPGPAIGGLDPLALRKVPGPSPAQTIHRFLALTGQAEALIRHQVRLGMAESGLLFTPAIRKAVDGAVDSMVQANEALDLTKVPVALRPMTGVGTMLMLRSVLRYDLEHSPGLVIPDAAMVRRDRLQSWTIPETPISLRAISDQDVQAGLACRRCSAGDFLFSAETLDQVPEDFWRIFGPDPRLRRRYGADLYIYWAQVPGNALPPKPFMRLPLGVRRFLLTPLAGQSLLQWLLLLPVTLAALVLLVWWLWNLRRWRHSQGEVEGVWPHLVRVVAVLPPLLLVGFWQWYAINWINLIGPREEVVLVGSRLITALLLALLIYLLAEAIGQRLTLRRHADPDGMVRLSRRKGSGQILTVARTVGLLGVLALGIQTGQALGLTSLTLLAVSSVPALAISLGTQQLIRDIADGFSLWLDGQIKPGDRCTIGSRSGGTQGRIRSLGMRSVRLQEDDGTVLSIPNSQVASSVVANHRFRFGQPLSLSLGLADLQPAAVAERLETVRRVLAGHPELGDAKVRLESTDDGWGLTITGSWPMELAEADVQAAQERLMLELLPLDSSATNPADPSVS